MRGKLWMMAAVLLGSSTLTGARIEAQTSGTVKDDLFAGTEKFATNASSVTEVDMDPDSLVMVNGGNSARARRTVLSVVHTYTYEKPGMYNMADVDAFRNKLNTGDWHCSVHVRELKSGESTDVCRKRRTDGLQESAIITVEPKELTFIHTIKRPATADGKGGGDSWMTVPFGGDFSLEDGLPVSALSAELRANSAEMRVQGVLLRAEMAALRPQMAEQMLEMRANMAGMRPAMQLNLARESTLFSAAEAARLATLGRNLRGLQVPHVIPPTPPRPSEEPTPLPPLPPDSPNSTPEAR